MSVLEVLASLCTVVSVMLTVHLKRALYPVGILSTVLFFFVFLEAKLYASAGLQVYFTLLQVYGWWFWTKGYRGHSPPIGDWPWGIIVALGAVATAVTLLLSSALMRFTDASAPLLDTAILCLSALAQFLVDRKQLKSWMIWGAINVLSIYVYSNQKLWVTTALYVFLLANVLYGWRKWHQVLLEQRRGST